MPWAWCVVVLFVTQLLLHFATVRLPCESGPWTLLGPSNPIICVRGNCRTSIQLAISDGSRCLPVPGEDVLLYPRCYLYNSLWGPEESSFWSLISYCLFAWDSCCWHVRVFTEVSGKTNLESASEPPYLAALPSKGTFPQQTVLSPGPSSVLKQVGRHFFNSHKIACQMLFGCVWLGSCCVCNVGAREKLLLMENWTQILVKFPFC